MADFVKVATTNEIEFASDRDLRKRGTRTPGSNIPIVSEEESRMLRPDVDLVEVYAEALDEVRHLLPALGGPCREVRRYPIQHPLGFPNINHHPLRA